MKHVERTLLARPTEANLGGVPSVQNKIRAYINVKFSKMGQWTAMNLEVRIFLAFPVNKADQGRADGK